MVNLTLNTCVSKWELFVLKDGDRSYVKIGCSETVRQFDTPEAAIAWARNSGRWQNINANLGTIAL